MGVLEQVTKMKKQGISEQEIARDLSQNGISPKEINDALKQSQIKSAVSDSEMEPSMNLNEEVPVPIEDEQPPEEYAVPQNYPQNKQEEYSPQEYAPQQYPPQEYYPQEQYAQSPENFSSYPQTGINADTIIEIAEQIFSDRIRKFQKQADSNSEAVGIFQAKIESISERLTKIESIIDKLQIAILEKVGSYGQNLEGIKKEMSMMQDSFSKMVSSPKEIKNKNGQDYNEKRYSNESEKIKESLKKISGKNNLI